MEDLAAYHDFDTKFEKGNWTPTKGEWLEHEKIGRKILLTELEHIGVDTSLAQKYLNPEQWRASDFLERVIMCVAYKK